jgi:hypothetical protein
MSDKEGTMMSDDTIRAWREEYGIYRLTPPLDYRPDILTRAILAIRVTIARCLFGLADLMRADLQPSHASEGVIAGSRTARGHAACAL